MIEKTNVLPPFFLFVPHWDSVGFAIILEKHTSTKEEAVSQGETTPPNPAYPASQAVLAGGSSRKPY